MNFYKRHIGDYIKDAGHLTLLEHGVYARLMDVYYTRESSIPQDKAARLIGARGKDELQALTNVLDEFFTLVDGHWTQRRCEEEIGNASEKAEQNRENGKKGGRPRKPVANSQPTENPDGYDSGNHVGFKNNLSQTPDSRLQTPDQKQEASSQASTSVGDPENPPPSVPPAAAAAFVPAQPVGRNVAISILLRSHGIDATPANPLVCIDWAENAKVTDDVLTLAAVKARTAKPDQRIGVNYLKPIVAELLAAPEAKAKADDRAWRMSDGGIERKGRELGMFARGGESHRDFAGRIDDEIRKRKEAKP